MVIWMVSMACRIRLPAGSRTAPSPMARVGAVPAVSIWVALRVAQMVLSAICLATWSKVTFPRCPVTVSLV